MCLSAWGRSARPQGEALRFHAGHGLRNKPHCWTPNFSVGTCLFLRSLSSSISTSYNIKKSALHATSCCDDSMHV
jgi:hypothetical protein